MAITNIMRDWGVDPCMVRITTTDDLTAITTAGYLTAQAENIQALQNGNFEWLDGDFVLIYYSNGEGTFTRNAATNTFVATPAGGGLSATLSSGNIFVGNGSNVATGVPLSGDATIDNTGALTIANGAINLAKLAAGISPAAVVKFAGQLTTVGGSATEAFTVTGAVAATDRAYVQVVNNGTNNVTVLQAVVTANTLTITFSGDPAADTVFNYQLLRATS